MPRAPYPSQRRRCRLLAAVSAVLILVILVQPTSGTTITYQDTNFYDQFFGPNAPTPDWYAQTVVQTGPISGQFWHAGNGNPAPARTHQYAVGATSGSATLIVGHYNPSFVWDPSVHGAIGELEFSYDQITLLRASAGFRPALRQNGVIFHLTTALHSNDSLVNWVTFTAFSNAASQWSDITGQLKPDFSSAGAPIEFGYRTGLTAQCVVPIPGTGVCDSSTFRFAIDNYRVTIRSAQDDSGGPTPSEVPEPSTAALLSGATLWLAMRWLGKRRDRYAVLGAVFALSVLATGAMAATIQVTDVDGAWQSPLPSNPSPAFTISNGETLSTIRWGIPATGNPEQRSGYNFQSLVPPTVSQSVLPGNTSGWITLGEFQHINNIVGPDWLDSVELRLSIDLNVDGGPNIPVEFVYLFRHQEAPDPFDIVNVEFPTSQTFSFGGVNYIFELAFGRGNTAPGAILTELQTATGESSTARIWGRFLAERRRDTAVPEPATAILVLAGLATAWRLRLPAQHRFPS
jgi:hypothetical protein